MLWTSAVSGCPLFCEQLSGKQLAYLQKRYPKNTGWDYKKVLTLSFFAVLACFAKGGTSQEEVKHTAHTKYRPGHRFESIDSYDWNL